MTDAITKVAAMQDLATNEKRRAFERLQTEEPDVARFLTQVAKVFGKPAAIRIRFGDGTVYRGGHFTPAQDFRDFGKRLKCALQRFNSTLSDGQNESDTLGPSMTNRWR